MKKIVSPFLLLICFSLILSGCFNFSEDRQQHSVDYMGLVCKSLSEEAADEDISLCGIIQLHNRSLNNLNVNGIAELHEVKLSNLNVNGPVQLLSVHVANELNINGPLQATASTFNVINISTTKMQLNNCRVKRVTLKPSEPMQEQVVILKNTIIDGPILFEQGNGRVIFEGSSRVTGKIVGGTAIHK